MKPDRTLSLFFLPAILLGGPRRFPALAETVCNPYGCGLKSPAGGGDIAAGDWLPASLEETNAGYLEGAAWRKKKFLT